jgi:hypothetical protein
LAWGPQAERNTEGKYPEIREGGHAVRCELVAGHNHCFIKHLIIKLVYSFTVVLSSPVGS